MGGVGFVVGRGVGWGWDVWGGELLDFGLELRILGLKLLLVLLAI